MYTLQAKLKVIGNRARYPVVRSKIRTFAFDFQTTKFEKDDVFVGEIPDRMIVGLLDSRAFNGSLEYYPLAFQKFGLIEIRQIVESEAYPYAALQLNGDNALKDLRECAQFLDASGAQFRHG